MWLLKEFFVAALVIITLDATTCSLEVGPAGSDIRNSPFWYHFKPMLNHRLRWNGYDANKLTSQDFRTLYDSSLEATVSTSHDEFDQPKIKSYMQQQSRMTGDTFDKRNTYNTLRPAIHNNNYITGDKATPPPKSDYDDEFMMDKRQEWQQLRMTGDTFDKRNTYNTLRPAIHNNNYIPGDKATPPPKSDYDDEFMMDKRQKWDGVYDVDRSAALEPLLIRVYH